MSANFEVNAQKRGDSGKGASRRLRRAGLIPGIVYGAHKDPTMISVPHNELAHSLEIEGFYANLLSLKLEGKQETVVLKDLQRHPAKPFILHVDFQRVQATRRSASMCRSILSMNRPVPGSRPVARPAMS
ncbi:MAG: 50S ribosomal protein L25 [Candidatus Thiodiazotropha sp.]